MNKYEEIECYLNNYQDLWWKICDTSPPYPMMDVDLELSDGEDLVEMKNKMRVMKIFFAGDSTFFPAFWIGNDNFDDNLDQQPIFIIDFETNEAEFCHNFKHYISKNIDHYLEENSDDTEAISAKNELCLFSDNTIKKGDYPMNELVWD